jgi:hypothetical protein
MSTALTMTAPSGGISPSSASMRVSSVAQLPLSAVDDGSSGAPPSAPSAAPPSRDAGAARSNARYARGVTTVNPGAGSTISLSSRYRRRASRGCRSAIGRPPCMRQVSE